MTKEHSFVAGDYSDRDLYVSSRTRERALNSAIVRAEISESFEEYLEIFEAFYADDIEVSSETAEEPIRGKDRVSSLLATFLVPLHVMAEVGGLSISIRQTAIPGDVAGETHSAWTLDLVGVSGRTCTMTWRSLRKWNGSRVVYEHHYDEQQNGGPLTSDDLSFDTANLPWCGGNEAMGNEGSYVALGLKVWKTQIDRADKLFGGLSSEEVLREIAPGRNRLLYLWGHLTAVHDAMLPLLGLSERLHPEFDVAFVSNPDKSRTDIPSHEQVRQAWNNVNIELRKGFEKMSWSDWLQRHTAVSEEDFAKDVSRNRFAILLSRTNHLSYHLGQAVLGRK